MKLFKSKYNFISEGFKDCEEVIKVLENLKNILLKYNYDGQASFLVRILDNVKTRDWLSVKEQLNDVDLWGGSGAVWEVYLSGKEEGRYLREIAYNRLKKFRVNRKLNS